MSLFEFLKSKVFLLQVLIAVVIIGILGYLFMHWLTFTTEHGQEVTVPDLSKLSEQQVEEKLNNLNLEYVFLDSVDYRKE